MKSNRGSGVKRSCNRNQSKGRQNRVTGNACCQLIGTGCGLEEVAEPADWPCGEATSSSKLLIGLSSPGRCEWRARQGFDRAGLAAGALRLILRDRKSTRLNSSH